VKQRRTTSTRGKDMADQWDREFPMSTGYWTRANPELCLLFTRGQPKRLSTSVRKLIIAPRREHSRKPEEIRTRAQKLTSGPYIELFARQPAPGWDAWGNETAKFQEVAHG
jgi:N6-adenosine-specific RNA methylase IME4